jgi:hypothetical protein
MIVDPSTSIREQQSDGLLWPTKLHLLSSADGPGSRLGSPMWTAYSGEKELKVTATIGNKKTTIEYPQNQISNFNGFYELEDDEILAPDIANVLVASTTSTAWSGTLEARLFKIQIVGQWLRVGPPISVDYEIDFVRSFPTFTSTYKYWVQKTEVPEGDDNDPYEREMKKTSRVEIELEGAEFQVIGPQTVRYQITALSPNYAGGSFTPGSEELTLEKALMVSPLRNAIAFSIFPY